MYNLVLFTKSTFIWLQFFWCFREPSLADKQYAANLCLQIQAAQKRLGQSYSVLVLGIGMTGFHHTSCGK